DRNRSHWSTSKTPSYTKSVSWQHHLLAQFIHDGLLTKSKKGYLIKNRKQLSGLALEMDPENKFSGMMQ
ncbi:hypothetical protein ACPBXD_23285, partial [Escherichia coli]